MHAHLIPLLYSSSNSYFVPIPLLFLLKSWSFSFQLLSLLTFTITSVSLFTEVYYTIPHLPLLYTLHGDLYCSGTLYAYHHISHITKNILLFPKPYLSQHTTFLIWFNHPKKLFIIKVGTIISNFLSRKKKYMKKIERNVEQLLPFP